MRGAVCAALLTLGIVAATAAVHAQKAAPPDVTPLLDQVSAHVIQYYSRAQSLVAEETVVEQPIRRDRSVDGFAHEVTNLLRFEWEPPADGEPPVARTIRELLKVGRRPPKSSDRDQRCAAPVANQPEPLAMFLKEEREAYAFRSAGPVRLDGRILTRLEFRERPSTPRVTVELKYIKVEDEECLVTTVSGRPRGSAWVDPATGEVFRLDLYFPSPVEYEMSESDRRKIGLASPRLERWEETIRYRRVSFTDPDEDLVLPYSIDLVTIYGGGLTSIRRSQRFTDYRRFLSGGRIVE